MSELLLTSMVSCRRECLLDLPWHCNEARLKLSAVKALVAKAGPLWSTTIAR